MYVLEISCHVEKKFKTPFHLKNIYAFSFDSFISCVCLYGTLSLSSKSQFKYLFVCICVYAGASVCINQDQSQSIRHFHTFSCKFRPGDFVLALKFVYDKIPIEACHKLQNAAETQTHIYCCICIYCDPKQIQNSFMAFCCFVVLNFVFSSKSNSYTM